MSHGLSAALPSLPDFGQQLREGLAAEDKPFLDILALIVILAGAYRAAPLSPVELAFLAACGLATVGTLPWRRRHPAAWVRYRELPTTVLRLAVAASPTAWKITAVALNGTPPFSGGSALRDGLAFCLLVLFASFSATGSILALARPVRLALHIPAQAATMLLIAQRNGDICATAAFQHPAAQRGAAVAYGALSALLQAAAAPGVPLVAAHDAAGRCKAVLGAAELLLGFVAPTLGLAVAESLLFQRHRRLIATHAEQRTLLHPSQPQPAAGAECSSLLKRASSGKAASSPPGPAAVGSAAAAGQPGAAQLAFAPSEAGAPAQPAAARVAGQRCYEGVLAWLAAHAEERAVDGLSWCLLLVAAAWQAVLLVTPE